MIRDAGDPDWWDSLNGLSAADGADLLARIITGLEAEPARFRAMNPPNGWGDYDSLLEVLREMRDCSAELTAEDGAATWSVSG